MTNKLVTTDLVNLQSETTAVQTINANFAAVVAVIQNLFSLDGTSPNALTADMDTNSHRILNLPTPLTSGEPLRLADVGGILPANIASAGASASAAATSATAAAASASAAAGFVGAATQAPKWTTGRTITLTGDTTGTSVAFDGQANLSFATTIATLAVTNAKMAVGAAVANIGFTPANVAGQAFTGEVRLNYTAASLNTDSAGFRGIPINEQDAAYTFVIDDVGRMVRHNSASAHAYTINPVGTTAYPIGASVAVRNIGTGVVTLTRGAGVSLRKVGSATDANVALAQWGLATLIQEATNTWVITGTGIS